MSFEHQLREAMNDLASDITSTDGLAAAALGRARRRQYAARTAVAGTAAAVTIPAGLSVLDTVGSETPPTSADPAASSSGGQVMGQPGPQSEIVPAPSFRELGADELAEAFETCRNGPEGEGNTGYEDWEAAFGLTVETDVEPGVPTTWVGAQRGDQFRADCALDSSGELVSGGGTYGAKSTPALLYALVDGQEGDGAGRYVDPIEQVTVQYQDGPERAAVLHEGFWFLPFDESRGLQSELDEDASSEQSEERMGRGEDPMAESPGGDLIGIPAGYTFRGYDAEGELVYDSTTDGPSIEECYADPSGSEFVGSSAGHEDPSECVQTHQWQPSP